METLPPEIVTHILEHLPGEDLARLGRVSRAWAAIVANDTLWKTAFRAKYAESNYSALALSAASTLPTKWRLLYRKRVLLDRSWERTADSSLQVLTGHRRSVTAVQCDNEKVISGSLDATLKVWSLRSGKCLATLTRGLNVEIQTLVFNKTAVFSGADTVRQWDLGTFQFVCELRGHSGDILCLRLAAEKLLSSSVDGTIRLYDLRTDLTSMHTLQIGEDTKQSSEGIPATAGADSIADAALASKHSSHAISTFDIHPDGIHISAGDRSGNIRFFDLRRPPLPVAVLPVHSHMVVCVQYSTSPRGPYLASCSAGKSVRMFDSRRGADQLVQMWAVGVKERLLCMHVSDTKLCVAGQEGDIKVIDLESGTMLAEHPMHSDAVYALYSSETHVVSGGRDCSLRIRRFRPSIARSNPKSE